MSSGLKLSARNGNGRDVSGEVSGEERREAKGYPLRARGACAGDVGARRDARAVVGWAAEAWAPEEAL